LLKQPMPYVICIYTLCKIESVAKTKPGSQMPL